MHGNVRFAGRIRLSNNTPANRHDVENSENFPSYLIILSRADSLFFGVIFETAPEVCSCSENLIVIVIARSWSKLAAGSFRACEKLLTNLHLCDSFLNTDMPTP